LRRNYLLKHATEGKIEKRMWLMGRYEEKDVSSFWMTLSKQESKGN
jgi:hypothetical protein